MVGRLAYNLLPAGAGSDLKRSFVCGGPTGRDWPGAACPLSDTLGAEADAAAGRRFDGYRLSLVIGGSAAPPQVRTLGSAAQRAMRSAISAIPSFFLRDFNAIAFIRGTRLQPLPRGGSSADFHAVMKLRAINIRPARSESRRT